MKRELITTLAGTSFLFLASYASAHFQLVIPSKQVIEPGAERTITLDLRFTHPMEGAMMNMEKPVKFGVLIRGQQKKDLSANLVEKQEGGKSRWEARYRVLRPGDYVFYVVPKPYWEPAEEKFIIHYTKVVVDAMGLQVGWDKDVGLKMEITPLTRPYGLWAGNVFRGVVKLNGKPVPYCRVEVEYYNEPGKKPVKAPTSAHVAQVIKTDANGVFCYAMPRAGWWGFAALTDGREKLTGPDGKPQEVELGALIWVRTDPME